MNIGFDAKRIFYNISGLGNYGRNIYSYLKEFYPENNYFLFSPNKKNRLNFSDYIKIVEPEFKGSFRNSLWRTKGILKESAFKNLDVYHGLSNELPVGISKSNVKSVISIHDLIFVRFPELYKPVDRKIYLWKMKKSCKEADKIIAISNQTKNDIIEYLDVDESKISIVYQGCNEIYFNKSSDEDYLKIKNKYNLPDNYILNVGTIEARKNALLLVKAMIDGNIDFPLVIVGKETSYTKQIRELIAENNLQSRILIINNVEFLDLPAIYQNATVFIYPSFFEGFGIPIIEAFNSNVPVITSDINIFKEVADNSAVFFENNNEQSLIEAIRFLLNSKLEREKYIAKGNERAKVFTGKNIAKDLMNVYKN